MKQKIPTYRKGTEDSCRQNNSNRSPPCLALGTPPYRCRDGFAEKLKTFASVDSEKSPHSFFYRSCNLFIALSIVLWDLMVNTLVVCEQPRCDMNVYEIMGLEVEGELMLFSVLSPPALKDVEFLIQVLPIIAESATTFYRARVHSWAENRYVR